MTATEPPHQNTALDAPAIEQALFHIRNAGPVFLHCVCGRCLESDDYSYPELALDACMTHVLDMVGIIECCTPEPHPSARVSLHTLHELIANARMLLCIQRQAMRDTWNDELPKSCGSNR